MFVIVFLFIFVYFSKIPLNNAHCMDIHQHIVSQGLHYVPGPNPCTLCVCEKSTPKWCKQVLCSPPQNCKSFEVGNSCCEFKCLDDILSKSDNYNETYNLALRLIASAVTAILSLSLLFFLIHRLRQRKIRLRRQNRQLSEDQRSLNSIGYITGSLGYLPSSIGYLGSANNEIEFHYDESNVHYPLWKPPGNYFPRGEAPPPYEEAVRAARSEAEMANNQMNSNSAPFTFSSNRNENVSLTLVHNTHVSITPNVQQSGVASSQCNVMLHQSNNVQSIQTDATSNSLNSVRNETSSDSYSQTQGHTHGQQNTSVSLACGPTGSSHDYVIDSSSSFLPNTTVESQVDVHYENYNRNTITTAPVLTVSVKNEESFSKQALNVDYLRERIDRGTYTSAENKPIEPKNESLSCSSSWRKEAVQHYTSACISKTTPTDIKQKIIDKNKNYKITELPASSSKTYRGENQLVDPKLKRSVGVGKEISRVNKPLTGRINDKQRPETKVLKCHSGEINKETLIHELSKHRTIPQKFSKTIDSDLCYVNTSDFGKRKQDDDFSEHCDMILKQHNIDKIRYAAEKLDKKNSERTLNASIRNSLCAPAELRNSHRNATSNGLLKAEMSSHRTLPKNLRELSEAFYLNFDNTVCDEINLDCLMKKTLPRNSAINNETQLVSSCPTEKIIKVTSENASNTLGKKYSAQKYSSTNSASGSSAYRNTNVNQNSTLVETATVNSFTDAKEVIGTLEVDRERNCVSYRCSSPIQDDVDDYRSECENCKSLSFEDCNDEEGDLLNETMTLQRRPMEQGEEHSFYRTSLTLPSHTKKTTRSMTLNTPRESWFMAMQEMTSSSESD